MRLLKRLNFYQLLWLKKPKTANKKRSIMPINITAKIRCKRSKCEFFS